MTSNRRGVLMWIGMACLLSSLTLVLFWADLKPSSSEAPSTSLPGAHRTSTSDTTAGVTTTAEPSMATIPPSITPTGPTTGPTIGPTTGGGGSPVRPESARGLTVPAAATFARVYFVEAINHAKVTGDVAALRAWSDVSCTLCRRNIAVFAASNQTNGLLTGDHRWRDPHVGQVRLTDPTTASVDLAVSVGRHTYRPKPGARPMTLTAQTVGLHVTLAAVGGDWVMFDWERLP